MFAGSVQQHCKACEMSPVHVCIPIMSYTVCALAQVSSHCVAALKPRQGKTFQHYLCTVRVVDAPVASCQSTCKMSCGCNDFVQTHLSRHHHVLHEKPFAGRRSAVRSSCKLAASNTAVVRADIAHSAVCGDNTGHIFETTRLRYGIRMPRRESGMGQACG